MSVHTYPPAQPIALPSEILALSVARPLLPSALPSALSARRVYASAPLHFAPPRLAIVGARLATPDACEFAEELARRAASLGATIVSGGALGIDAAAHYGALRAGGTTWCVLPHGEGEVFPPENAALFEQIACSPGALIYPFESGAKALRHRFLQRNAVLVALSEVLVLVQAGAKSGARNAALWARRFGRPVFAAPQSPWERRFIGCNIEIALGAIPLASIHQVLGALGLRASVSRPAHDRESPPRVSSAECLPPEVAQGGSVGRAAALLFAALPQPAEHPLHIDVLIEVSGVAAGIAMGFLYVWLARGIVRSPSPQMFVRK